MSKSEHLPPNFGRLDKALRSIGYSFEAAVADIIDNSIDAKAKQVLVRFILRKNKALDLVIWDDGGGMNQETLREAMRFGADVTQDLDRLGKFGLGLKLASLSQAKELRVFSRNGSKTTGRGWLEEGVSSGFMSTIYEPAECREMLKQLVPDRPWNSTGTVVWWSQLYRVGQSLLNPNEHAQKLVRRLKDHLGLSFHRFLSGRSQLVVIEIDVFDADSCMAGLPLFLEPMNPFGYIKSGKKGFPLEFFPSDRYANLVKITGHIWPPNSTAPEYSLPGGSNSRQGFYFYRNNRLIQGGGWNGTREAEPHRSLARLEIDLHPDFDMDVSLDIKKVEIQLPPDLMKAIQSSKADSGLDFKKYLSVAEETYRTKPIAEDELPLIPTVGIPSGLRDLLQKELRIDGTSRFRELSYVWQLLDDDQFFEVDRENATLVLNKSYRKQLLHGLDGSSTDLPVVKCLLFLVLKEVLDSHRISSNNRKWIEMANRILVSAVKHERGQVVK